MKKQSVFHLSTSPFTIGATASFERIYLSNWIRKHHPNLLTEEFLSPTSWRCSMVWSAYLGLALSLEGVGTVLKLKDQKLKEGGYFCVPCKPAKVNGGILVTSPTTRLTNGLLLSTTISKTLK